MTQKPGPYDPNSVTAEIVLKCLELAELAEKYGIKFQWKVGEGCRKIARDMGVSHSTISRLG